MHAAKLAHTQALEGRHLFAAAHGPGSIERKAPALHVVGPSGCGKTTLCQALATAWLPSPAVLWLDGAQLSGPAAAVQLVGPVSYTHLTLPTNREV